MPPRPVVSRAASKARNIDLSVLVPGDICGDEAILHEEKNRCGRDLGCLDA